MLRTNTEILQFPQDYEDEDFIGYSSWNILLISWLTDQHKISQQHFIADNQFLNWRFLHVQLAHCALP